MNGQESDRNGYEGAGMFREVKDQIGGDRMFWESEGMAKKVTGMDRKGAGTV